jgi:hypothetical protein
MNLVELKPKQTITSFIDETLKDGELEQCTKIVLAAQTPQGQWVSYWLNMKPSELAFVSLLLSNESLKLSQEQFDEAVS